MLQLRDRQPQWVADLVEQRPGRLEPCVGLAVFPGKGRHARTETRHLAPEESRDLGGGGGLGRSQQSIGILQPTQLQRGLRSEDQSERHGPQAESLPRQQRLLRFCLGLLQPPLTPTERCDGQV